MPPRRKKEDIPLLEDLGANIQSERRRAGITQEALAEMIEVHPRIVQKIEAGDLNPKSTTLIRIQAALQCTWETLIPRKRRRGATSG